MRSRLAVLPVCSLLALLAACAPGGGPGGEAPPLVETTWLADRLGDDDLVILDVRPSMRDYLRGHLPSAQYLSVENLRTTSGGVPGTLLPREVLEVVLGRLGIEAGSTVVVYGGASDQHATYVAGVLRMSGLERVAILDGGFQQWTREGRPVSVERQAARTRSPRLSPATEGLASFDRVRYGIEDEGSVIVDARPVSQYMAGHLPGAINRYWKEDVIPSGREGEGRFRSVEELEPEYHALGITPDKDVIVYCNSAHQASAILYNLRYRMGYPSVRLYDGSWLEWSMDPDLPRETGTSAPPEAVERARAAADALTSELKRHLIEELGRGGPPRAIRVCSEVAQAIAAGRSDETTSVRRVSLKPRNPEDRPDVFEESVLYHMELLAAEGKLPAETLQVVAEPAGLTLRYMSPIMVASPCLSCHGDPSAIDPEVKKILAERYPDDRAVGYQAGDLRGAVSVSVVLEPAAGS